MAADYNTICLKRGTTAKNSVYLGKLGEIVIDTDKQIPVIHDGVRIGGHPLYRYNYNYVVDGDFNVWLEGTSQTTSGYGSDTMYMNNNRGSTKTHSRQLFTVGQTDVHGGLKYYSRTAVTSVAGADNYVLKRQKIEDVRRLAGKTVTLSFWAKADANKNIAIEFSQNFGVGGDDQVNECIKQLIPLTSAWQKFTVTGTLPSVSGKTIVESSNPGTIILWWFEAGSALASRSSNIGQQSGTFDIARVRLVEGTVDGDGVNENSGETLFRVNRYYETGHLRGPIAAYSTTYVRFSPVYYKVTKRIPPSSITVTSVTTVGIAGTIGSLYSLNSYDHGFAPVYNWAGATAGTAGTGSIDWISDTRL